MVYDWGQGGIMLQITTLIDNTSKRGSDLLAEHGFSCLIERNGEKILFDTGASRAFIENAHRLGRDLSRLDHLVLSHRHWTTEGGNSSPREVHLPLFTSVEWSRVLKMKNLV